MTAHDVTIAGLSAVIDRRYRGRTGINLSVTCHEMPDGRNTNAGVAGLLSALVAIALPVR